MEDTILTFTVNDLNFIKTKGRDEGWVLNKDRAAGCKYLVCVHSQGSKKGTGFLLGLISRIVSVCFDENSGKERWAICISEYASIDIPNVWEGWRNPVRYTTLEELGIDVSSLNFEKIQEGLSIEQAKQGLSKFYGVTPQQIEIIIKG